MRFAKFSFVNFTKASAEPETVILTATVTDSSPQRSLQIANAIGQQFGSCRQCETGRSGQG